VLLVPIVGSYMKAVAMELKSPALKAASVFTFGNSYLSMVLLISLLIRLGMDRWWGDPLGALVMVPFIVQKGIQILIGEPGREPPGAAG
jgi:divalent metal cation (Fe/Co/Zn/Cd) transporter